MKRFRINELKAHLKVVNWFGVAAGVPMLMLPFTGAWWHATVGTEAVNLAFSPFYYSVDIMGQSLTSSLVGYFILAAQLTVIIGGVLMLAGSLATNYKWGKKLMRFGAMKVFWMVVSFIAVLLLGAFFVNNFLAWIMSGMFEGGSVELSVPYIVGTNASTIQVEDLTVTAPISTSLTSMFWVAVLTAAFGLGARIYHRRLKQ